ncbi:MAG TPA: site-specific integrase, partial [Eudoraea sp.]|nr:site-specific integrase [Eudoraea sp.]
MNWEQAIQDYQHYLRIERGLAPNSIQNYTRDVKKLQGFLEAKKVMEDPLAIDRETVQLFIHNVAKTVNPR